MLRFLTVALAVATLSHAPAFAAERYTMSKGECHDANGQVAPKDKCLPPPSMRCRDLRGIYKKCPIGCSLSNKSACRGMRPLV